MVGPKFAPFDEPDESGNDGDFLLRWDQVEDFGVDDVNSRELMGSFLLMDQAADVGDAAAVDREAQVGTVILHGQCCGIVGSHVCGHEPVDGEVGDDVSIVNQDRISFDPTCDVFNAAAGFEEFCFVKKGKAGPAVFPVRKGFVPGLVQVVGVDGKVGDSGLKTVIENVSDEGTVGERDERLGESSGHRLESCSQSGAEEEGFAHGQRMI